MIITPMLDDYTFEELYEMFGKLPDDVKEAYHSVGYAQALDDITKKFQLHLDKVDILSTETFKLMLGITKPEEFVGRVERSIAVPRETAKQIAEEVNQKIFRPIRASLMKIHKMVEEKEIAKEDAEEGGAEREDGAVSDKINEGVLEAVKSTAEPVPETVKTSAQIKPLETANIAEEKLKKTFTIPKKEGGYTGKDPYREETA